MAGISNVTTRRLHTSNHISEEKERKEKGSKRKFPPWICLPSLLGVFSKDDLHRLYPDLFEVIKIVTTLPVTVASCERAHSKDFNIPGGSNSFRQLSIDVIIVNRIRRLGNSVCCIFARVTNSYYVFV